MKDQFISYENAMMLKQLGFDKPCITSYDPDGRLRNPFDYKSSEWEEYGALLIEQSRHFVQNSTLNKDSGFIAAPVFQQAFQWIAVEFGEYEAMKYDEVIDNATLNSLIKRCAFVKEVQSKL